MYAIAGTRRVQTTSVDHSLTKLPSASQSSGSGIAQRLSLNLGPRCRPTSIRLPGQNEGCCLDRPCRQTTNRQKESHLPTRLWLGVAARRSDAAPRAHHGIVLWLPPRREEYAITDHVGDPFMHMVQPKPCA